MKITRHSALLACRLFRTFLTSPLMLFFNHPTFIQKLCYKLPSNVTVTFMQIFLIKIVPSLLNGIKVAVFAWYSIKIRVIFGVQFERQKVDKKIKPTWRLKHANSILESFEYFCQISSKSIHIILSYTVSKLGPFFETQCSNEDLCRAYDVITSFMF